jgi:hypothetical protein
MVSKRWPESKWQDIESPMLPEPVAPARFHYTELECSGAPANHPVGGAPPVIRLAGAQAIKIARGTCVSGFCASLLVRRLL